VKVTRSNSTCPCSFILVFTFRLVLQVVQSLCIWHIVYYRWCIIDPSLIHCWSIVDSLLIHCWSIVDLSCSHIFVWDNSWKASILDCNKVTFMYCECPISKIMTRPCSFMLVFTFHLVLQVAHFSIVATTHSLATSHSCIAPQTTVQVTTVVSPCGWDCC